MIVDKAVCVIGSANINDRSLLSYRDTEMAAVIHSPEVSGKLEEDLRKQHAAFLKAGQHNLELDATMKNSLPIEFHDLPRKPIFHITMRSSLAHNLRGNQYLGTQCLSALIL
ncbi:phospholipase D, putative [Bodo saltans]|uniref:Phospholipase D, putative n=1 Tax=Bodo saltans TaxID=75058 RepID=A0A0S4JHH4_BODSA|nr:phospholipase D, putative [Bodo saltans]|eukprot:CUG90918.1 phospholipase D, putative [Bodo saltans]